MGQKVRGLPVSVSSSPWRCGATRRLSYNPGVRAKRPFCSRGSGGPGPKGTSLKSLVAGDSRSRAGSRPPAASLDARVRSESSGKRLHPSQNPYILAEARTRNEEETASVCEASGQNGRPGLAPSLLATPAFQSEGCRSPSAGHRACWVRTAAHRSRYVLGPLCG